MIAVIIVGLFLFSSIALVIPDDKDKDLTPRAELSDIDDGGEDSERIDISDNGPDTDDDSFRVYEIMYPEEEEAYTPEYWETVTALQERNLADGWGNAGPGWSDVPGIDGPDIEFPGRTRAMPTPVNDKLIVILINFTDSGSDTNHNPDTRDTQYFNESVIFNTSAGANTMVNYLEENSYHTYSLTGEIAKNSSGGNTNGWYTASHNESYYGMYEMSSSPPVNYGNAKELVTEAVQLADLDINFSHYDTDSNGFVDHIMIVHAGLDDASDGDGTGPAGDPQIWSHRGGQWVNTNDGVWVIGYTMLAERSVMGVFAHEYGHDMGLPDLYNTAGGADPVKKWDIMGGGAYNTYSAKNTPSHFSSWCKEQLGWHDPIVINETNNNQGIKTVRATTEPTNENTSYKINLPGSQQWFYVENRWRNLSSYDAGLPDSGIVIWHFDKSITNNNGNPKRLVPENANLSKADLSDVAWSLEDNQILFNDTTTPDTSYNSNSTATRIHMDMINNSGPKQRIRILFSSDMMEPGAPTILSAADVPGDNGNTINITFSRSSDDGIGDDDVKNYNIYVNDTGQGLDGSKHLLAVVPADNSATYYHLLTGIEDKVTYYFSVRADDGPNESPWSNNVSAMSLDNIANPPTGLAVTDRINDDGGNISLSWSLSLDDSIDIVGYNVTMNDTGQGAGGGKHVIATLPPGTTTFTVGNLTNGLTYYFKVTAFDEVYNLGTSGEDFAVPVDDWVGKPASLVSNPPGWTSTNSFDLSWTNPQDNAGIVGVWYKLDAMPLSKTDGVYTDGADIESLNVNVLGSGNHSVYIWLVDGENNTIFMNWATANLYYDGNAPGTPKGLTVTPSGWTNVNSFTINWTNPSELTGIKGAYYKMDTQPTSPTDGTYFNQNNIDRLNAVTVPDDNAPHPTWVWLRDGIDNIDHTNSSMVTLYYDATAPAAPQGMTASPANWTNDNNFTITWTNPTDLSGVTGLYYKLDEPPLSAIDGTELNADDISELTEIKVGYDGAHVLYVWLVDNATNTDHSNYASTQLYYDTTPPSAPDNLQAIPSGWSSNTDFIISWTNPDDDLAGVGGVYYKLGSVPTSDTDGIYVEGNNIQLLPQVPVSMDGEIKIYLWLNDTAGNTDWRNYNFTTIYRDTAAPGKPINIVATPGGWTNNNNFSIAWTNPKGTSGIKGVYYKLDSAPTSNFDGKFISGLDIKAIGNIQVDGNGEHTIFVWLIDVSDNIDFNNHNTTVLKFDDQPPAAPSGLTAEPAYWNSDNRFTLTWSNPDDISGIAGVFYKVASKPAHSGDGTLVKGADITKLVDIGAIQQGINTVYVWLLDSAGNYDHLGNSTVQILWDSKPPVIFHTKVEAATEWVAMDLYASIEDTHANVKAAFVFFKSDGDTSYSYLPMIAKGKTYELQLPAYKIVGNSISYFLMAVDNAEPANVIYFGKYGTTTTNITAANDIDVAITTEDMAPPAITHVPITTGTEGKAIEITASVHDDASGISSVTLYYKRTSEEDYWTKSMTKSYSYYTVVIDGSFVRTEGVEYYLKAIDSAPARNTAYFGRYGQTSLEPNAATDLDIVVTDKDTTPPIITFGPTITGKTESSVSILWRTDEPADGRTEWGYSTIYSDDKYDSSYTTEHWANLTGLDAGTLYHFRVSSSDEVGNGPTYSNDYTFSTLKPGVVDTDGDGIPDAEDIDDDNDGMKDDWEIEYNFDPLDFTDADEDTDGDGFSNRAEYFFGTDPRNPRSTPVGQSDIEPPTIVHTPVYKSQIGEAITIRADVYDDDSGVREVLLYYRIPGAANYTRLSMGNKSPFMAIIPAEITTNVDYLEYYIYAVDFGFNIRYYAMGGQTLDEPNADTDIDIVLKKKTVADDQTIWELVGEPFGITDPGTCIVLLIVLIVVVIAIGYGVARASRKRDEKERERESEEKYARRQREIQDAARRTGGYPGDYPRDGRGGRAPPRDIRSVYQEDQYMSVTQPITPAAGIEPIVDFSAGPQAAAPPAEEPRPKVKPGKKPKVEPKKDELTFTAPDDYEGDMEMDEVEEEDMIEDAPSGPEARGRGEKPEASIFSLKDEDEKAIESVEAEKRWKVRMPAAGAAKTVQWSADDDDDIDDEDDDELDDEDLDEDLDDDDFDIDDEDDLDDFDDDDDEL